MGVPLKTEKAVKQYMAWDSYAPYRKNCKKEGCKAMTNMSGYCPNHQKQMLRQQEPEEIRKARNRGKEAVKKKRMAY